MVSSQPEMPAEGDVAVEAAPANVVGIDQGRERRDRQHGQRSKQDRVEKSERREKRREAKAEEAAKNSPDVYSEAELTEGGLAVVDERAMQQAMLTAPIVNTSKVSAKTIERLQTTYDAANAVMLEKQDVTSAVAPLIRHLTTVTDMFNESQVQLGRTQLERDILRNKLAEQLNVSPESLVIDVPESQARPDTSVVQVRTRPEVQSAAGTAKTSKIGAAISKSGLVIQDTHTKEQVAKTARRRQLLATVVLTGVGIGLYIAQRNGKDVTGFSRDSLAELQYVGLFFNIFLMLWMLYRVARVGGKGARWLFPNAERGRSRRR